MQLSFCQTIGLFRADVDRRLTLEGKACTALNVALSLHKRGVASVFIYRIKRYLHLKNSKVLNLAVWLLRYPEFHYCHNELDPRAEIGSGLVVSDFGGLGLSYANIIGKTALLWAKPHPLWARWKASTF